MIFIRDSYSSQVVIGKLGMISCDEFIEINLIHLKQSDISLFVLLKISELSIAGSSR